MKLKLITAVAVVALLFTQCNNDHPSGEINNYPADVAHAWMQMQIRLTKSTAGYNSIVSNRSFGYAGVTMYQSIYSTSYAWRRIFVV